MPDTHDVEPGAGDPHVLLYVSGGWSGFITLRLNDQHWWAFERNDASNLFKTKEGIYAPASGVVELYDPAGTKACVRLLAFVPGEMDKYYNSRGKALETGIHFTWFFHAESDSGPPAIPSVEPVEYLERASSFEDEE